MSNAEKKDYSVGYGKPPKSTQFKKGQSGNPKGRPKGSLSLMTVIERELNSKVTVTEQGQQKKVRKKEVVAKQLVNKAASGDLKAMNLVIHHSSNSEAVFRNTPSVQDHYEILPADKKTLDSMVQRIRQNQGQVSFKSDLDQDLHISQQAGVKLLAEDEKKTRQELTQKTRRVLINDWS